MSEALSNIKHLEEVNRSAGFESKSLLHILPQLHDLLLLRKKTAIHLNTVVLEEGRKMANEQYSYINTEIKKLLNL